jgi:hypothetical protein
LWEDQDLRGKATGKYSVADFLRISGFKRNQAYQRWEQIKHSIKEAMEGLEGEDKLLALSLLMRRFLPWKPEIVADIALQSLTTTRDLNHV